MLSPARLDPIFLGLAGPILGSIILNMHILKGESLL